MRRFLPGNTDLDARHLSGARLFLESSVALVGLDLAAGAGGRLGHLLAVAVQAIERPSRRATLRSLRSLQFCRERLTVALLRVAQ